jgi:hypothetical protein
VIVQLALLVAASVLASELFLRLPLMRQVNAIMRTAPRCITTLRSNRISDHWKEVALPAYAFRIAGGSILFFLLLCIAVAPVALIGLLAPGGTDAWLELLMQPFAIAVLCICSILYIVVRTRLARA